MGFLVAFVKTQVELIATIHWAQVYASDAVGQGPSIPDRAQHSMELGKPHNLGLCTSFFPTAKPCLHPPGMLSKSTSILIRCFSCSVESYPQKCSRIRAGTLFTLLGWAVQKQSPISHTLEVFSRDCDLNLVRIYEMCFECCYPIGVRSMLNRLLFWISSYALKMCSCWTGATLKSYVGLPTGDMGFHLRAKPGG